MPLKIGAGDVGHIHDHAKETYPEECSGVIVGMDVGEMKIVVDVWRAENTFEEDERGHRFLIDPKEYIAFEKRAGERDMDILGVYHSHPDHPAKPSDYDREHAWPGWSYVIASVSENGVEDMRSWLLKDDRSGYKDEPIVG
ncbi:M67 family metallopeptidase [soil metagenome]